MGLKETTAKIKRAVMREVRKGATVEVIRTPMDVTLGPMACFDKRGRVMGGSLGDDTRYFVDQIDLRVTRPDGTVLIPMHDKLVVVNR